MKKTSIFLSILSICFGIGILLLIIGLFMGGSFTTPFFKQVQTKNSFRETQPATPQTDNTDIKNLSFDLSAASITIQTGDSFSISGGELSKNEVKNGTWKLKNKTDYKINLGILRFILPSFSNFNHSENDSPIIITIPEDAVLESAEFDFSATDITIEKLQCNDNVDFDLAAGDLTINSLTADKAEFELAAGNIKIKNYMIQGSADLDCSMGNITLGTKEHTQKNSCNSLKADAALGNITVCGKLTGKTHLNASMGDIDLRLAGSEANYRITDSDVSMGDIKSVTKDFINNSSQPVISDDTTLYSSLSLACSMGNIDIYYLYANH